MARSPTGLLVVAMKSLVTSIRLISILASLLALAACNRTVDTQQVEQAIKTDIERNGRRLAVKKVVCPRQVPIAPEGYFRCGGELEGIEGAFTAIVQQTDNQGHVQWQIPHSSSLLNLVKLEDHFQTELGKETGTAAAIDCGASYRANQPGDAFECAVVGGLATERDRIDRILVRIDRQGNLTWQPLTPEGDASLLFASSADSDSNTDGDSSADRDGTASSAVATQEREEIEKFQQALEEDEDSNALD